MSEGPKKLQTEAELQMWMMVYLQSFENALTTRPQNPDIAITIAVDLADRAVDQLAQRLEPEPSDPLAAEELRYEGVRADGTGVLSSLDGRKVYLLIGDDVDRLRKCNP